MLHHQANSEHKLTKKPLKEQLKKLNTSFAASQLLK